MFTSGWGLLLFGGFAEGFFVGFGGRREFGAFGGRDSDWESSMRSAKSLFCCGGLRLVSIAVCFF